MTLLALESVTAGYGLRAVLDSFSLSLRGGEGVFVTGPNGSGKSTLLKCVAGTLAPRTGDIRLGGVTLIGRSTEWRARSGIATSLQGQRVFLGLTVGENLSVAAGTLGPVDSRSACSRALEWFPVLAARQGTPAEHLNGGTRQVLSIAMATVRAGFGLRVLLIDEPSLGLDALNLGRALVAIRSALEAGAVVLSAEHDQHFMELAGWPRVPLQNAVSD